MKQVSYDRATQTLNKELKVCSGVDLGCVNSLIGNFIEEIERGDSGDHLGEYHGIAYRLHNGVYVYMYQTETMVIIRAQQSMHNYIEE